MLSLYNAFVTESNAIEGIHRSPTNGELRETQRFVELTATPSIVDLIHLVNVYQPDAVLRERKGLDVQVGNYIPPRGGPEIVKRLTILLTSARRLEPWRTHIAYESLHPFTDGNGRSGRALWLWGMKDAPLGFLHTFYYQTLQHARFD